ncbi:Lysine--tRNA ligase [Morus notabilis]|uniref:lysine--tRNA ligase n=1 Tax=Morus notabilis TaxID=981085 RepID=W9SBE2_9ROSA|nr:Lysine--tRNA ligase [Morus notabilis]
MEAVKAWGSLSLQLQQPLKHLFHFTTTSSFRRSFSSPHILRCCSSSSAAATTTTPSAVSRNRRSSSSSSSTSSSPEAVRAIRLQKVEELRSKGLEPYAYRWDRTHSANQLQEIYRNLGSGEEMNSDKDHVSIAGRIVARRAFGKLAFFTLRDDSGTIQLYCEKGRLVNDQFEQLKTLVDIGDILGASGSIKRTEKGNKEVHEIEENGIKFVERGNNSGERIWTNENKGDFPVYKPTKINGDCSGHGEGNERLVDNFNLESSSTCIPRGKHIAGEVPCIHANSSGLCPYVAINLKRREARE